jgi:hypothetical protein
MLRRVALVRTDVPQKRRFFQEPHGVTSQKTSFFIVTAVKTSNFIYTNNFWRYKEQEELHGGGVKTKQTQWLLLCRRTLPTEQPPLVGEF